MRVASLVMMHIKKTTLPDYYYSKNKNQNLPTALLAFLGGDQKIFTQLMWKSLKENLILFFIVMDFLAHLQKTTLGRQFPKGSFSKRLFSFKTLLFNHESYIADILIIFKYHFNLNRSINVVDSLYSNKIDILINRQQTNVIDNYLAIKAKNLGIFILGDLFEEIFSVMLLFALQSLKILNLLNLHCPQMQRFIKGE